MRAFPNFVVFNGAITLFFISLELTANASAAPLPSVTARIVGGSSYSTASSVPTYPYMVSLQKGWDEIRHHCGGTMIAPDMVLTAAHCNQMVRVVIGDDSLDDKMESIGIKKRIPHPEYRGIKSYDVQVLKLNHSSSLQFFVRLNSDPSIPCEIDDDGTIGEEEEEFLQVIGRGRANISFNETELELAVLNVTYRPNNECRRAYDLDGNYAYSNTSVITPDTLCAIGYNNTGTCRGDSGSPLLAIRKNIKHSKSDRRSSSESYNILQIGIVSFSSVNCVHVLYPDVYHRVSESYEWIREVVCTYSSEPPAYFACDELKPDRFIYYSNPPSQAPSTTKPSIFPTLSQIPSIFAPTYPNVPIMVEFTGNDFPYIMVWRIKENNRKTVFQSRQEFDNCRFTKFHTLVEYLRPDTEYILDIYDRIAGEITIYLGNKIDTSRKIYYERIDDMRFNKHSFTFITSINNVDQFPSMLPTVSPINYHNIDAVTPAIERRKKGATSTVLIQITRTESRNSIVGWSLIRMSTGETVIEKSTGSYSRCDDLIYLEAINVYEDEEYSLILSNHRFDGEIIVFYGNVMAESTILSYYKTKGYNIFASIEERIISFKVSPDKIITVFPALSPTFSPIITTTPTTTLSISLSPTKAVKTTSPIYSQAQQTSSSYVSGNRVVNRDSYSFYGIIAATITFEILFLI